MVHALMPSSANELQRTSDLIATLAMTSSDLPGETRATVRALLPVFVAAIFVSAALLFAVQPMFTKMVLPRLGGAAAVWSVAMVFFQTTLLAGYAYAHLLTRFAPGRTSVIIHLVVMIAACFALPLHIASRMGRAAAGRRGVLAARAVRGLDRAAVLRARRQRPAAAGLVRAHRSSGRAAIRISSTRRAMSAASSRCSSYPLAIEPFVRLGDQTWLWTAGYYVLILLVAGCGLLMLRSPNRLPDATACAGRGAARRRPGATR